MHGAGCCAACRAISLYRSRAPSHRQCYDAPPSPRRPPHLTVRAPICRSGFAPGLGGGRSESAGLPCPRLDCIAAYATPICTGQVVRRAT